MDEEFNKKLQEYASLVINFGIKVKKGFTVLIVIKTHAYEFARLLVHEAYKAGAKKVIVKWYDDNILYEYFVHENLNYLDLDNKDLWDFYEEYKNKDAGVVYVRSINEYLFNTLDMKTQMAYAKWAQRTYWQVKKDNAYPYSLVAYPEMNQTRAIFPELSAEDGLKAYFDALFKMLRIEGDGKCIERWEEHNKTLKHRSAYLNDLNLVSLHYKNSIGTDLEIELADKHLWFNSIENKTRDGKGFVANLPTEEVFTVPKKYGANGTISFSLPLNYGGKSIEHAKITLKNGRVEDYNAGDATETLGQFFDEGHNTRYLGEVALVPISSPIAQMHRVFYDTLIDENASCHFAFGNAYAKCVKGGLDMTEEELAAEGVNRADAHLDFMIGTDDLSVIGTTQDGRQIEIMKNGNFII